MYGVTIWQIPANGGMLTAPYAFHGRDVWRALLGLTSLFVIINGVSSFQIDGMPMFDLIWVQIYEQMKRASIVAALIVQGYVRIRVVLCIHASCGLRSRSPKWWVAWLPNWVFGVVGMLLGGASIAAEIYVITYNWHWQGSQVLPPLINPHLLLVFLISDLCVLFVYDICHSVHNIT